MFKSLIIASAFALGNLSLVAAQITPDATLGNNSTTREANINGLPSHIIENGATRGTNLFHSFSEFNVNDGRGAYFVNPTGIDNILTRVTGGNASNILGTLGVLGNANLFLLNPNGIVFGPNAKLDLNGSFLGTTADSILFNNYEFSAINPTAPPLLTIDIPIGLRFRQQAGDINSSANLNTPNNLTLQGGNLNLTGRVIAGGDLTLEAQNNLTIRDTIENPFFAVSGQDLLIQGNNIDIFTLNNPQSALVSYGNLTLKSANPVIGDAHYYSGGNFRIEKLDGSLGELYSPNDPIIRSLGDVSFDSYIGASLHIIAGGKVEILGSITITEPDLINGLFEIITLSNGENLSITGFIEPTLDIRAGVNANVVGMPIEQVGTGLFIPFISSTNNPTSADITIGDVLIVDDPSGTRGKVFLTNQYFPDNSLSGNIVVNSINNQGFFSDGGFITIDSRNDLMVDGMINTTSFFGKGGDIKLLALNDITINSNIPTGGGKIQIIAENDIFLDQARLFTDNSFTGSRGDIKIKGRSVILENESTLSTSSFVEPEFVSTERQGNINIETQTIKIGNRSQITATTSTTQDAGIINIWASELIEINQGAIRTSTFFDGGKGGDITIKTGRLILDNVSNISASSLGSGNAGNIIIEVTDLIDVRGVSGIQAQSNSTGEAGNINIKTGKLILQDEQSVLSVATSGEAKAGTITIDATEFIEVLGGSGMISNTLGSQPAGDIHIKTSELTIKDNNSFITTSTDGSGNAGNLTINTDKLLIDGGILSTETDGTGNAGNLFIQASDSVIVRGQGETGFSLITLVNEEATGQGGDLTIITGKLTIENGAQVGAGTFGDGNSGKLTVNASNSVQLSGLGTGLFTQTEGKGNSNDLTIVTGQLLVENGATISTRTFTEGMAGSLNITATDFVKLTGMNSSLLAQTEGLGDANSIIINTPVVNIADSAIVSAKTTHAGDGGSITITAPENIDIQGLGKISVETSGSGNAGNINLESKNLNVANQTEISASTTGEGAAGNININAENLNLTGNARIISNTFATGDSGNININVRDNLILNDSLIAASTAENSTGKGGSIFIDPNLVQLNNSNIAVSSQGLGTGGNIELIANTLNLNNSSITAETNSADGGSITLNIQDKLNLLNSSEITATAGKAQGAGNGGNINLNANFIVAYPSNPKHQITANAFAGDGGNINITTKAILGRQYVEITASSELGLQGNVEVNTLDDNPLSGRYDVEKPAIDIAELFARDFCKLSEDSSFVYVGRTGRILSLEDEFESTATLVDWVDNPYSNDLNPDRGARLAPNTEKTTEITEIRQAQGWVKLPDGTIVLTAHPVEVIPMGVRMLLPDCN